MRSRTKDTIIPTMMPLVSHLSPEVSVLKTYGTDSIKRADTEVTYCQGMKNFITKIAVIMKAYRAKGTRCLRKMGCLII